MNQITRILSAAWRGDGQAAAQLLPLVYDELRKLASLRMASERPGQTLGATALVHEAYLRLVDVDHAQQWNGRGHFFAAAAEAMRRILVEKARRRGRVRHGGDRKRLDLEHIDTTELAVDGEESESADGESGGDVLALDEALGRLEAEDAGAAGVVKLRYFAGLTIEEAAAALGVSVRTANRDWAYAKAWLYQQLRDGREDGT